MSAGLTPARVTSARLPSLLTGERGVATLEDDPRSEMRVGLIVAAVFFVGFLGWAALSPLDAAAYASGRVTVAGHRQTVQHREGGIVSALNVKEGQRVTKDQVLVQLAGADVQAQERALAATVIGLKAQRARLLAEQLGGPIVWPVEFTTMTGENLDEAQRAVRVQTSQYQARSTTLRTQGGVLGQRNLQLQEQISGYQQQIASLDEQSRLLNDELVGVRSLNEKGYAPMTKVRELERTLAQLQGQRAGLSSSIASSRERIGETRLQNVQLTNEQQEAIAKEIRDVDFQLNDAAPKWQAARDMLARTQIRSPATGTVVGLTVFTVGGVVAPGQKILDVVPDKAPLVVEAQVSPNDADDLNIGQQTQVRFTGIHERDLPRLSGELSKLSADSFTDEKTGAGYFMAEVTVPVSEVDKIRDIRTQEFNLRPGMPVQILVPLKKRTALQYLIEPFSEAIWRSGREH